MPFNAENFRPLLEILPIVVGGFVLVLILRWLLSLFAAERWRYRATPSLFTPAEMAFLNELEAALPEGVMIFGKVRLADLIEPDGFRTRKGWMGAFNRISAKHVDFVICDRASRDVIGVIELDDASHRRADRIARDEFVDEALGEAGIPILHVPVQKRYNARELRGAVQNLVGFYRGN